MKLRALSWIALTLSAATAGFASAVEARDWHARPDVDYARVVEVRPIIETYHAPIHSERCWSEPVTYREPDRYVGGSRDRAPAVLGGIIGGVVGNQFGSGRGRDAATLAGAALGYSLARDAQRHGGYYREGRSYTRYEERCERISDHRREERVVGYDVAYRYNGRVHWTRTDHHPGERIPVEVDVRPLGY